RHTRFSRDWSSDVCSSDLPTFSRQVTIDRPLNLSALSVLRSDHESMTKPADRHWSPDILLLHRYLPHRSVHPLKHKVDPSIRKAQSFHDTAESPDRAYAGQNVKQKNKAGQVLLQVVH